MVGYVVFTYGPTATTCTSLKNNMKASTQILQLQIDLGIPDNLRAPRIGPLTRARFEQLAVTNPESDWPPANIVPLGVVLSASSVGGDPDLVLHTLPDAQRLICPEARTLVESFEGLQLEAYQDEVGVWTIGYGHTGLQHKDGTVYRGRTISKEKADQLLDYDMTQFEHRVTSLVRVPINDYQFGALVAFDFNTGGLTVDDGDGPQVPSGVLRALNVNDMDEAGDRLLQWNHAGGKVLNGLTRRRNAERALFMGNLDSMRHFEQG